MDEIQEEKDLKTLKRYACQLMEHFDTVQIFCTKRDSEDGGTVSMHYGDGNWFARYGQIELWVKDQASKTKEEHEV